LEKKKKERERESSQFFEISSCLMAFHKYTTELETGKHVHDEDCKIMKATGKIFLSSERFVRDFRET